MFGRRALKRGNLFTPLASRTDCLSVHFRQRLERRAPDCARNVRPSRAADKDPHLDPLPERGCRFSLFSAKAVHANAQLFCSLGARDRENRQPLKGRGIWKWTRIGKKEGSEMDTETGSRNSLTRRLEQSLAGQTPYGPAIRRTRALRAVEILRAGVPVEHRPFHSGPSALGRDLREPLAHRLADPAAPILLEYEKIFQVESRMAAPGRIGTEKKREAEGVACVLRNQTFEGRVAIFHLCAQPGGSCLNRFGLTLELRKCADEAMDRFGVTRRREADGGSHQGLSLNAARRLACSALNLESRPSGAVRTSQTP